MFFNDNGFGCSYDFGTPLYKPNLRRRLYAMPVFLCPACGARLYVRRGHAGRAVRCPYCPGGVRLTPPTFRLRDVVRPSHPVGWWVGTSLLTMAVALVTLGSWSAAHAQGGLHRAMRAPAVVGTAANCLTCAF